MIDDAACPTNRRGNHIIRIDDSGSTEDHQQVMVGLEFVDCRGDRAFRVCDASLGHKLASRLPQASRQDGFRLVHDLGFQCRQLSCY
ncbi:hypothetical protein D9M70_519220 [compost metagenome]